MRIKELRREARQALKGNLLKATLPIFLTSIFIYVGVAFLYQSGQTIAGNLMFEAFEVSYNNFWGEILLFIIEILLVFSIFILPFFLNFGVIINTIKVSRNEKSNFFKEIFSWENIKSFFSIWWELLKKYAIWLILIIVSMVRITSFSGSVSNIYESLLLIITFAISGIMISIITYRYMLVYYLKYDYSDKTTKDLINKSRMMMRGNKAKAVVIPLTLIGWYLLNYLVISVITMLFNFIWEPEVIPYYTLPVSSVPLWATIVVDAISFLLSSMLSAYICMINYQLYMEQKPLEIYNDDYIKPETNAKKYIWILIGVIAAYIAVIIGMGVIIHLNAMSIIL